MTAVIFNSPFHGRRTQRQLRLTRAAGTFSSDTNTGCGTQHPHRALGGTCVLLAAAPTATLCFRRWRRSLLLQAIPSPALLPCGQQGPTPADGPQRNYPPSCRNRCSLPVRPHPVKMRLERSAERDKREYKNNFSAIYGQSKAAAILDHKASCDAVHCGQRVLR